MSASIIAVTPQSHFRHVYPYRRPNPRPQALTVGLKPARIVEGRHRISFEKESCDKPDGAAL
jgi:hypothetical protein